MATQSVAETGDKDSGDKQNENDQKPPARNTEWDWLLKFVGGYTPRQVIAFSFVIMIATQTVGAGVLLTLFGALIGQNSQVCKCPGQQNNFTIEEVKEAILRELRNGTEPLRNGTIQPLNDTDPNYFNVTQYKNDTKKLQDEFKHLDKQWKNLTTKIEDAKNCTIENKAEIKNVLEKQQKINERLDLQPHTMEIGGFMKIGTFGPVILIVALVEILLMFFVGNMFYSVRKNSNTTPPQANGRITQGRKDPELKPIDTNNNNMAILCFRNDDETRCENWAKKIVDSPAWGTKPQIKTRVINSVVDVQAIPACKAALVFVNPDEREMIIEDERHHIGRGLRRQAVQRLMDSGVAVFVMIYRDKGSNSLEGGQLYNKRLDQIDEHHQLKKLKAERRIISFRDTIHAHQSQYIVDELKQKFT